jgi:LysR family transcriptional regulator, nod-box dependent transcriptional activator
MNNLKNLRSINLNGLPVLRELIRHVSVSKAAAALNLTQPAVSNALKQLRLDFKDDLIRRNGKTMELTPKALQLRRKLDALLETTEDLVFPDEFELSLSEHVFRIAATDHVMSVLAPSLAAALVRDAPKIRVHFQMMQLHLVGELMTGGVDFVIIPRATIAAGGTKSETFASIVSETIATEPMVCIGRNDDAELRAGLSRNQYLARQHVGFFVDPAQHVTHDQQHMAISGLVRNDRMLLMSYAAIPAVVAASGCLAIVPQSVAKIGQQSNAIQIVPPPIPIPDLEMVIIWHKRNDADPAFQWMRALLKHHWSTPIHVPGFEAIA